MRLFVATGTAALALLMPTGAAQAQDLQARSLAATCANCHGTDGNALGAMKPLAGMQADRLLAILADYKSGVQPATVMHQIVKGYSDEQLRLIAGYFQSRKARP
jgi:sulfide dehydrogenase cytochrome subunit